MATFIDEPVASQESLEAQFEQILKGLVEEPEFAPYRDYSDGAIERSRSAKASAVDETTTWLIEQQSSREPLEAEARRMTRSHGINRRVAAACGTLFAMLTITAGVLAAVAGSPEGVLENKLAGAGLLFAAAFAGALATTHGARKDMLFAQQAVSEFDSSTNAQAEATLRQRILGEFSIALRDELRAKGVVRFPTNAPRLIELADDTVVGSRSIDRVQRFVASHETSAVGIAGPRGVGKTTLLRAVAARIRAQGGVAAIVSAPVEYSAIDLLKSLAFEVHEQFEEEGPNKEPKHGRALAWCGTGLATVGALCVLSSTFPTVAAEVWANVIALAPLVVGFALLVSGTFLALLPRWRDEARGEVPSQLSTLVRDLEFETTNTGSLTAKGFSLGEVTLNRSVARRSLSQGDIAVNLRRALQSITADGTRTVMIAVDELDKLPSHDAAIRTINVLKDIMRVPGVHVLVTVSDEALASFALGTFERDAFDSTFDAIFDIERLSLSDATHLIGSRVVGFPDKLLALCLVPSAGLARDLIREARAIIDKAAEMSSIPPWADLARSIVFSRAQSALAAYARTGADLAQVPLWTAAIEGLREHAGAIAGVVESPLGLSDDLASHYSRAAISLAAIEWLQGEQLDENTVAPTLDQLRDTVLLASRRGGASIALENLKAIGLGERRNTVDALGSD